MPAIHAPLRSSLLLGFAFALLSLGVRDASAEPCFASDGDGTYDQGAADDGIITITSASTSSVPPASTPYDCSDLDFALQSGASLLLQGNPATGAFAALEVRELTIASGASVSANGEGCSSPSGSTGPDASNVCSSSGKGVAVNGNDFGGAGGGGHGGRGASGAVGAGGAPHGSATEPLRFGATGGSTGGTGGGPGGDGGGIVWIVADSVVHDGVIASDGAPGGGSGDRVAGGGAGGSIYISAASFSGASGTFVARGGNAPGTAGGGGGGRVSILMNAGEFDFDASDFDVSGGLGGTNGDRGTVYVRNASSQTVRIFHGFTFEDFDYSELEWIADDSALNQYCEVGIAPNATPSITAENISLGGTISCPDPIASFEFDQTGPSKAFLLRENAGVTIHGALALETVTTLQVQSGVTLANTRRATDMTFRLPDGNDQIWHGVTLNGAPEGRIVLEAPIALSLLDATIVNGNAKWLNLTALTIDATSSISADAKGCLAKPDGGSGGGDGRGPDCTNTCVLGVPGAGKAGNDFGGAGGGGYGGQGGSGGVGAGGMPFGDAANPRQFGASGGNTGGTAAAGGTGGGLVRINVSGTFTNDGIVSASGGNGGGSGGRTSGGGAGGAIAVRADTYSCTTGGTFVAPGGDGAVEGTTGGGGGGRILVNAAADTCAAAPLSGLEAAEVAPGGTGTTSNGASGTVSFAEAVPLCGDPVGFGTITASDALFVLRAAVGNQCCDPCACDVNGSTDVSATDALLTLRRAVGHSIPLLCPGCP